MTSTAAAAADSDRIVFFGDSLTDAGTVFDVTSQTLAVPFPLASAGYAGVFSDGPVYAQILPGLLGIGDVDSFAAGGGRALGTRAIDDVGGGALAPLVLPGADPALLSFDLNLGAQVGRYIAQEAVAPTGGTTTVAINIGLNDLAAFAPTPGGNPVAEGGALVAEILGATALAAGGLALLGLADAVVLYSFPAASFFPSGQFVDPALLALGDQLFAAHAAGIELAAATLNALGVPTEVVPLGVISAEIAADPETFGFLSLGPVLFGFATDPAVVPNPAAPLGFDLVFPGNPAVAGLEPDQIAFYDLLHPTTALHGVWAAFSAAVLGDETHFLGDGKDKVKGGDGDDFVLAGAGKDKAKLGDGDDVAFGGLGRDKLEGGDGGDILAGGAGDDDLRGGDGADVLAGGTGDDKLRGGDGADLLIGGLGRDDLKGEDGDDVFFYVDPALIGGETGADRDRIDGGKGEDTLYLVVSDAVRAEIEAVLAAGPGKGGKWSFDALDLEVTKVEDVVLLDARADLAGVAVPEDLATGLAEAGLWGLY